MSHTTMKDLPKSERPYERFQQLGAGALSDAELLAIIIRCGTRERTSLEVAQDLLSRCRENLLNLYEFSRQELEKLPGIGKTKAIQLKAIAELSNRIVRTNSQDQLIFDNPETIALHFMEDMRHEPEEILYGALFDGRFRYLGKAELSRGGANYACVTPAKVFREAILRSASHIILLHNHPSGDCRPSEADICLTERIVECGGILGLHVADHIVIGDNLYYSFRENAIMPRCGE